MDFVFLTTNHTDSWIWFRDNEDYTAAMNITALTTYITKVKIIAFILMSNHVHFVLKGCKDDALRFINYFKSHYLKYLHGRYKTNDALKKKQVDIREISIGNEYMERAIAYTHMNCVAAKICFSSYEYRWGSGGCFFNQRKPRGRMTKTFSKRSIWKMMHSRAQIPGEWLVGDDAYILPESYVDIDFVENRVYRSPARYLYFLNSSSKAKKRLENDPGGIMNFSDEMMVMAVKEMCRSLFQKKGFTELGPEQKVEVIYQMRTRFKCDPRQIARLTSVPSEQVIQILDSL